MSERSRTTRRTRGCTQRLARKRVGWRPSRGRIAAALGALSLAPALPALGIVAQDVEYECTIIASSDEFDAFYGVPTINAYGRVAFAAQTSQAYSLRTGTGDVDMQGVPVSTAVVEIPSGVPPDPNAQLIFAEAPAIDDQGRLVFSGTEDPPVGPVIQGIYRKRFDEPTANDAERLIVDQTGLPTSAISLIRPNQPVYANTNGLVLFTGRQSTDVTDVALRSSSSFSTVSLGTVWEYAQHRGRQPFAVFTRFAGNAIELLFDTGPGISQPIESVNLASRSLSGVSMAGSDQPLGTWIEEIYDLPGTRFRVRLADPVFTTTLVDDGIDTTGYSNVPNARPEQAAVNSYGEVVFGGYTSEPILVSDGDFLHRVVCRDQLALFGTLPFSNFFFQELSPQAFNNDGQIAFLAGNGFGGRWVLRADPLSTARPASCVGLVDDTPCDDGDPESVAYCAAEVCTAVPEPGLATALAIATGSLAVRRRARSPRRRPAD